MEELTEAILAAIVIAESLDPSEDVTSVLVLLRAARLTMEVAHGTV